MNSLDRYTTADTRQIWSERNKMRVWARVETAAADAQGAPPRVIGDMMAAYVPTPEQVAAEESVTRHDVVAFLNLWRANMPEESASWVHRNLTSSDLVDTANAVRMNETADLLGSFIDTRFVPRMAALAIEHRLTVRVGRTHGQTAEVTTWGHRLAEFTYALDRASRRLRTARANFAVGKLSGPVGDFKRVTPAAEQAALVQLGLSPTGAASQVVMRDAYADYVFALAQIATVVEAIALEVRLSSRSDTGEVAEYFYEGEQYGSSAMPHKRNPIVAEQLCGLARLVRAQVDPVMQGVALHHERDISHSSVERVALETVSHLTVYMVRKCLNMMDLLVVYKDVMRNRVTSSPELMSAAIKDYLIDNGVNPEAAWNLVRFSANDVRSGLFNDYHEALHHHWDKVTSSGPLTPDRHWYPEFGTITSQLADPAQVIGKVGHIYAEMEEFAATPPPVLR